MTKYTIKEMIKTKETVCDICKRENGFELIREGELCISYTKRRNNKTAHHYYHWMCIPPKIFESLVEDYSEEQIQDLNIKQASKNRIIKAFEDNAINETKEDDPVFVRHHGGMIEYVNRMKQTVQNRNRSWIRLFPDVEMNEAPATLPPATEAGPSTGLVRQLTFDDDEESQPRSLKRMKI